MAILNNDPALKINESMLTPRELLSDILDEDIVNDLLEAEQTLAVEEMIGRNVDATGYKCARNAHSLVRMDEITAAGLKSKRRRDESTPHSKALTSLQSLSVKTCSDFLGRSLTGPLRDQFHYITARETVNLTASVQCRAN